MPTGRKRKEMKKCIDKQGQLDLSKMLAIKKMTNLKKASQIEDMFSIYRKIGLSEYDAIYAAVESILISDCNEKEGRFIGFDEVNEKTKEFLKQAEIYSTKQKFQNLFRNILRKERC